MNFLVEKDSVYQKQPDFLSILTEKHISFQCLGTYS